MEISGSFITLDLPAFLRCRNAEGHQGSSLLRITPQNIKSMKTMCTHYAKSTEVQEIQLGTFKPRSNENLLRSV